MPGAGDTLPYLHSWQKMFKGDSIIFDYPYMWDYIDDPGCYKSLQIMAQDAEEYRKLGLGGMMSCQNLRVFMPNGLGMHLLGSTLWNGQANFDAAADEYFAACYGEDGKMVKDFISCIAENRKPDLDVDFAIQMSIPGILAHQSAVQGGMPVEIPQF